MPITSGKSSKIINKNVGKLVSSFEKKGKIGTSKPKNKKAAVKQAVAIAYSKANESFRDTYNMYMFRLYAE